ncbi:MAG: 50S ribosomal protein L11 methyltransferase [Desulfovibrionales bacterium]
MTTDSLKTIHRLDITLPFAAGEDDLYFLQELVPWGWEETVHQEQTRLTVHCHDSDQALRIRRKIKAAFPGAVLALHRQADRDWMDAWKEFFTPIPIRNRFLVLPPWLGDTTELQGRTPILINPKSAFGTGHHATTALCLEALVDLADSGVLDPQCEFLDLGTGSGILGIGCAKLGLAGLGLDIDPEAVRNARENRALNGVPEHRFLLASGSIDCLQHPKRFKMIVANILAGPLEAMAGTIVDHLQPDGVLVLSGLLREQEFMVTTAYTRLGLPKPHILRQGEWSALIWELAPTAELS